MMEILVNSFKAGMSGAMAVTGFLGACIICVIILAVFCAISYAACEGIKDYFTFIKERRRP